MTDISSLSNIDPTTISDLYIVNNSNFGACNLPNFCTYLSNLDNTRTINGNKTNCLDTASVVAACTCPPSLTHSGSVASGTYKAGQTIQSTANVPTETVYQAGKSITILPGFR